MINRLFVYGTLRQGSGHPQALILASSAKHAGLARVRGCLFCVSHYPGLVEPETGGDWVSGDLFEGLSEEVFARLDQYEGAEYRRQISEVIVEGRGVPAFLYYYVNPTEGLDRIESGDWLDFSSKSSLPE